MVAVLVKDAGFALPPHPVWVRGRDAVVAFIAGTGAPPLRAIVTHANGQPAIGWYVLFLAATSLAPPRWRCSP
jgi:hypothetical protein